MKTTITICLVSLCSLNIALSQCDPVQDSLALVALYNATDGPNWKTNSNWLVPGVPIWLWYGVKGNPATGCVDSLDLDGLADFDVGWGGGNDLKGTLPPEIGNLTSIRFMTLSFNRGTTSPMLTGEIPPELGNLSTLESLYLKECDFQGSLPPELGNLENLKVLEIWGNFDMESTLPPEWGNMSSLERLYIAVNFTGTLPPEIGNLGNLELLNLSNYYVPGTGLTGELPPELGNLSNLNEMRLSSHCFSGKIPPELGNLEKIEHLNISGNYLTGEIPPELGNLEKISLLRISGNYLSGEIPPEMGNLATLKELYLSSNYLTGEIPLELTNLDSIKYLNLSSNYLTGELPPELGTLKNLLNLSLDDNQLTGSIPSELSNLDTLLILHLENNNLSGSIPPDLGNLHYLRLLSLNDNQLSGSIPHELETMGKLEESFNAFHTINLQNNNLTGLIPPSIGNKNFLRGLDLSNNQLEGTIPIELADAEFLSSLNLSKNNITGSIPPEFGNFLFFNILDLSDNQLSGNLPTEMEATFFNLLFLQNNQFTFEHLSNVFDLNISTFGELDISPQKLFFKDTTYIAQNGASVEIDLEIDINLVDNLYQWTKNGNTWQPGPGNDPNSNTLTIPNIQISDAGNFQATVTNPAFEELSLKSHIINVKVCDIASDSLQLVALYQATQGQDWDVSTNWLQLNMPINTWHGITTNSYGCIEEIDLSDNNLMGSLPALDLNTLETLTLSKNALTGNIPLFRIPFINHLDLSHNEFNGNIPELYIPLINHLNYSNNNLNGAIPEEIGSLLDLQVLNLEHNELSDLIPPDLGNLNHLVELRLNNNQLQGELPVELTRLRNLEMGRVDFSTNNINLLQPEISFFCPYGDNILLNNPSYNLFLDICSNQCTGDEWNNLSDYPWLQDSLESLHCFDKSCRQPSGRAGFVEIHGIKVIFIYSICDWIEEISFYDCQGNLLEFISCDRQPSSDFYNTCSGFNVITEEEFNNLVYDVRWTCGQEITPVTSVEEVDNPTINHMNQGIIPLQLFPNPTNAEVIFMTRPDMRLEGLRCVNIWGQPVGTKVQSLHTQTKLELDAKIPGIYVIMIPGKDRVYVAKIVKEN